MGWNEFGNQEDTQFSMGKSVRWLEVPIRKFNDIVPHFVESLKTHQNNILKLRRLEQWGEVHKEQISAMQIINQLASLLSEMENLRSQVTETDLNKFDRSINNSKLKAKTAIRSFHDTISKSNSSDDNSPQKLEQLQYGDDNLAQEQLMAVADSSEAVKVQEQRAVSMERLEGDIQDINYMIRQLSQMVHEQGEVVERIDTNVETTHENVRGGERMLAQAARYKSGSYPLLGALLGSVLGGPVGLFAGFKLGSLAALGAGVLGFTGGRMLKSHEEVIISSADRYSEEIKNN